MAAFRWNDPTQAVQAITLQVADQIGQALVERARELVPVRTGATRDSITYRLEASGAEVHIVFGAYTPWSIFLELGTVKMASRPFLRPAIDGIAQDIASRFAAAFAAISGPSAGRAA